MGGRGWGRGILKSVRAVVRVAFGEGSVGLGLRSRMGLSTVGRVVQACHVTQQNKTKQGQVTFKKCIKFFVPHKISSDFAHIIMSKHIHTACIGQDDH